jgi:Tfp pilus assembly protein PilF
MGLRLASAAAVRTALGPGTALRDDRPVLEYQAARPQTQEQQPEIYTLLASITRSGVREDPRAGPALLWLESLEARKAGDVKRAEGRESIAVVMGFAEAKRVRADRQVAKARAVLAGGDFDGAVAEYRETLKVDPENRNARFALAGLEISRGSLDDAVEQLNQLIDNHPGDAQALNEIASALYQRGDHEDAVRNIELALSADPHYPEALANAGLMAIQSGDFARATQMLDRMRGSSPLGPSKPEQALAAALRAVGRD